MAKRTERLAGMRGVWRNGVVVPFTATCLHRAVVGHGMAFFLADGTAEERCSDCVLAHVTALRVRVA